MKRKVYVPGRTLESQRIMSDAGGHAIYAVVHGEEIVVLFVAPDKLWCRGMTHDEALEFANDLIQTYEAFQDDDKIKEMEKFFDG